MLYNAANVQKAGIKKQLLQMFSNFAEGTK